MNIFENYLKLILKNINHNYKELGKFDQSIESHQKAIEHEPENLAHYYYLSELKKEILNSICFKCFIR